MATPSIPARTLFNSPEERAHKHEEASNLERWALLKKPTFDRGLSRCKFEDALSICRMEKKESRLWKARRSGTDVKKTILEIGKQCKQLVRKREAGTDKSDQMTEIFLQEFEKVVDKTLKSQQELSVKPDSSKINALCNTLYADAKKAVAEALQKKYAEKAHKEISKAANPKILEPFFKVHMLNLKNIIESAQKDHSKWTVKQLDKQCSELYNADYINLVLFGVAMSFLFPHKI